MGPSRRAVVRILAEVDLFPIFALEPPGQARELVSEVGGRRHPPVAEDVEQKFLFGLRPTEGHPEVDMMQTQHVGSLQEASRQQLGDRAGIVG
jgi:hypothetical protein